MTDTTQAATGQPAVFISHAEQREALARFIRSLGDFVRWARAEFERRLTILEPVTHEEDRKFIHSCFDELEDHLANARSLEPRGMRRRYVTSALVADEWALCLYPVVIDLTRFSKLLPPEAVAQRDCLDWLTSRLEAAHSFLLEMARLTVEVSARAATGLEALCEPAVRSVEQSSHAESRDEAEIVLTKAMKLLPTETIQSVLRDAEEGESPFAAGCGINSNMYWRSVGCSILAGACRVVLEGRGLEAA